MMTPHKTLGVRNPHARGVADFVPGDFAVPQNPVGLGLFDSTDFSQWGIGEWSAIALGTYVAISLVRDVSKAKKTISKHSSKRKRKGGAKR